MTDLTANDDLTWDDLTWQDIQSLGAALAERHPDANILAMAPEQLAALVRQLPDFRDDGRRPEGYILSAIASAWIHAVEGEDDSSPFEYMA